MNMKPDGYVREDWKIELNEIGKAYILLEPTGKLSKPMMLVSPELMDWVEKMKDRLNGEYFTTYEVEAWRAELEEIEKGAK